MTQHIGVILTPAADADAAGQVTNAVDTLIAKTREAADAGVSSAWFSQLFDHDAITAAAIVGREVPGIGIGSGVVPLWPRHPLTIASQAQTAQAATGGRFTLGIGLGAKAMMEPAFGPGWERPIRRLRESLTVFRQAFRGEQVDFAGEVITAQPVMPTVVPGGTGVPVVVAAVGSQALRVVGELADAAMPFLAGPRALAEHIIPDVAKGAEAAGRPMPRIIAAVPAVVTDEVETVRDIANKGFWYYPELPSYRRLFAAEGVSHPADVALIGDEDTVAAGIRRYFEAGADAVVLSQSAIHSQAEQQRTWKLAGQLAKG
ncbi:TIGR03564 family F420-dependent LLM class oxidoreductase [Micromonospora sp. RP3T]|uniref:TIGR03564 family F420-dependent LLM class oxidoreductase n=1 Tax=Micromonospora sp. RP3T TaxID=2135446 RepID=UPI000D16DB45|nr:TIGR03564 family F420-dependent LLM class oxidoreductase [Micromonospora sp. RP3T]PTA45214.1 LLM class F420-dependent oxidoreductase [Micromonospora sp. RP3T]